MISPTLCTQGGKDRLRQRRGRAAAIGGAHHRREDVPPQGVAAAPIVNEVTIAAPRVRFPALSRPQQMAPVPATNTAPGPSMAPARAIS